MLQNNGLMAIIGAILGLTFALGDHLLINYLRRVAPQIVGGIGLVGLALLVLGTLSIVGSFLLGKDPTGIGLMVGILAVILIAAVCGIAAIHAKHDNLSFPLAVGCEMAQFGSAVALCYGIAQVLPNIAAGLHGGKPNDDRMIDWFPPIHVCGDWLYGTLLVAIILLEIVRPLRFLPGNTAPPPVSASPAP